MTGLRRGYTLVELIIVIAILSLLAGIAVPRFTKASAIARGAQILANMYSCEDAINIYYSKNSSFPDNGSALVGLYLEEWPRPINGEAIIKKNDGTELKLIINASSYVYVKPMSLDISDKVGRVTLGGKTVNEILTATEDKLILSDK